MIFIMCGIFRSLSRRRRGLSRRRRGRVATRRIAVAVCRRVSWVSRAIFFLSKPRHVLGHPSEGGVHSDCLTPSLSASAVIEFAGVAGLSLGTAWVTGRGPDGDGFTDRGPGDRARDTRSGTEGESPRQAMSRLDMRRFPLSRCRSPTCVTWSDVLDVRCVAVTAAPSESGPPATATATATDQTRGGALAYSLWAWTSGGRCGGANLRTCGGWTCVEQVWRWW